MALLTSFINFLIYSISNPGCQLFFLFNGQNHSNHNPTPNSKRYAQGQKETDEHTLPKKSDLGTQAMILEQFFASPVLVPRQDQINMVSHTSPPNTDKKKTHHPSGKYLLTIRGIFFWFNSLIAI